MSPSTGPFSLNLDRDAIAYVIYDLEGREIARLPLLPTKSRQLDEVKRTEANARLFKSSAEMLELLCEIVGQLHDTDRGRRITRLLSFILTGETPRP